MSIDLADTSKRTPIRLVKRRPRGGSRTAPIVDRLFAPVDIADHGAADDWTGTGTGCLQQAPQ